MINGHQETARLQFDRISFNGFAELHGPQPKNSANCLVRELSEGNDHSRANQLNSGTEEGIPTIDKPIRHNLCLQASAFQAKNRVGQKHLSTPGIRSGR